MREDVSNLFESRPGQHGCVFVKHFVEKRHHLAGDLRHGDQLIEVDGTAVTSVNHARALFLGQQHNDQVQPTSKIAPEDFKMDFLPPDAKTSDFQFEVTIVRSGVRLVKQLVRAYNQKTHWKDEMGYVYRKVKFYCETCPKGHPLTPPSTAALWPRSCSVCGSASGFSSSLVCAENDKRTARVESSMSCCGQFCVCLGCISAQRTRRDAVPGSGADTKSTLSVA